MGHFIPPIETFIQESQDAAKEINPVNVDESGDIYGMLRAFGEHIRFGIPFVPPPTPQGPVVKAGRSHDLTGDRLAKAVADEWDEPVADLLEAAPMVKASEPPAEFQKGVIDRLRRFGVSAEEARDLLN